jgi:transcription elongation factor GreA
MATKKVNYITKEGYDKLVTELNNYKEVELPAVLERLAEAKTLWDLSENFEYKSAMEDKDFISSKIVELEKLLANVEIIKEEKTNKASDVVDYGSKVVLKIEWDDDTYNVTVGWTWEVGVVGDNDLLISLDSPIWSAIKWHKAWDEVKMRLWNDRKSVKIIKVA